MDSVYLLRVTVGENRLHVSSLGLAEPVYAVTMTCRSFFTVMPVVAKTTDQNEYLRATWTWRAGEASPSAPKSAVPN